MKGTHWALIIGGIMAVGIAAQFGANSAPKTPTQKAEASQATARYAMARALDKAIRAAAKDPASIKYEYMSASADGNVVCAEFRGKNSFGALDKTMAVLAAGKVKIDDANTWNKHCTQPMYDQMPMFR